MIKEVISKLVRSEDLTQKEMEEAMDEIMSGIATPAQIGAFIAALRMKGETVDEIAGAAITMRAKANRIMSGHKSSDGVILDIVGTGGDESKTFNVSTTSAFVIAGAGVTVAKHGNRAVSSLCGAADVLENLGVNLNIQADDVERCIKETGIGFLFAPLFHGAMKHAAGPRKETGIRSVFNLLGPLTNPAGADVLLLGVYNVDLTEKIANVLKRLDTKEAFVVCGEGRFDEISICGPTKVSHLKNGDVRTFEITPEEFGFKRAVMEDIVGGDAGKNAKILKDILRGEKGPKRDMVLLNSGAALAAAGRSAGILEGIKTAEESIDSGKAYEKLGRLIEFTGKC
ncbi:MAG: anthranilate phosphoribosyltransferase [Deltaproteobacteria bacterium]|nr:anthranilate phosphoribosyltransferase [Deltaproteobacteria bacterium]